MAITYTFFTATTTAATIVQANPARRRLELWSYQAPEETDTNSLWINDAGNPAVPFQCKQLGPGAVFTWGGSSDIDEPRRLTFQSCPVGSISVRVSAGSHRGLVIEYT